MNSLELILYSRSGCCLCEGLEAKLRAISLKDLHPQLQLFIEDIDGEGISDIERIRYSMEVPVLLLKLKEQKLTFELPRVSPRLQKDGLLKWLKKMIYEKIDSSAKL